MIEANILSNPLIDFISNTILIMIMSLYIALAHTLYNTHGKDVNVWTYQNTQSARFEQL